MRKSFFIVPVLLFVAYSCGKRKRVLTPEQYMAWIKSSEDELVKTKEIGDYRFTLKLQPTELLLLKSRGRFKTDIAIDSVRKMQNGMINLVMDIGSKNNQPLLRANLANEQEYYQRMFYYNTEAQNDLYLVEGNDTLNCVFYHFEQTFNITPVNSMIMEFERSTPDSKFKDITLVFEDKILNTGIIKFTYKQSFLNNLPQLTLL